jgi:signal peptidase I
LRQLVQTIILLLVFLLVFRTVGAEPYQVPTGSMWPALAGNHRVLECPRCGYRIVVGRHRSDHGDPHANAKLYAAAACPNCGRTDLDIHRVPECPGDHLLVSKSVFDLRRPRRWEIAVFRCPADPSKAFVKRVVGLPGEKVRIRGGDIYINGVLSRKSLSEIRALRIPVFDNNYQPAPDGFGERWEAWPVQPMDRVVEGKKLHLRGQGRGDRYQCLVYRHYSLDSKQSQPLQDEYAYNCGETKTPVPVHDFMMECDIRAEKGNGWVRFGITDGHDRAVAELPVGPAADGSERPRAACLRETGKPFASASTRDDPEGRIYRRVPGFHLEAGRTYHVELALVDRRVSLAVDGAAPLDPVDLPAVDHRREMVRPVQLGACGVDVVVSNFRLYRDIHYTDAGDNGTRGVVSLGPAEYFVMGDNSPNSDDSRFWPNQGVVPERSFIGKPFLVHMPIRVITWDGEEHSPQYLVPDWGRIRWLR